MPKKLQTKKLVDSKLDLALTLKRLRAFTDDDIADAFGVSRQTLGNQYRKQQRKLGEI